MHVYSAANKSFQKGRQLFHPSVAKMIMSKRVTPPMRVQGQNSGPIFKISKFAIELIKMLFCSVAKIALLVLKMKISLGCIVLSKL